MKKALVFAAVGLLCFVVGTVGIYVAMPALSPERVDSTRVRLDRLGLVLEAQTDLVLPDASDARPPDSLPPGSIATESADSFATADVAVARATTQELVGALKDSLGASAEMIRALRADTSALGKRVEQLSAQIAAITDRNVEAATLSQSLVKLDGKQLGSILAGLELDVIELLYQKASARERTRLLESMGSDQAARFVRTLVKGPQPESDREASSDEPPKGGDPATPNPQ